MFFAEVTILMGPDGDRLPARERKPPIRGTVTFGEMNRDPGPEPYAFVADVWEAFGTTSMRGMAHMSSPIIIPNPTKLPGLLLSGLQRECWKDEHGKLRLKEHRQVWHVVPVQRQGNE